MTKIPSLAMIVAGVLLLAYGLNASNTVLSSLGQAMSGAPSNRSILLIAGGIFGIVAGGFGLLYRRAP
jgi:hypothetical protein